MNPLRRRTRTHRRRPSNRRIAPARSSESSRASAAHFDRRLTPRTLAACSPDCHAIEAHGFTNCFATKERQSGAARWSPHKIAGASRIARSGGSAAPPRSRSRTARERGCIALPVAAFSPRRTKDPPLEPGDRRSPLALAGAGDRADTPASSRSPSSTSALELAGRPIPRSPACSRRVLPTLRAHIELTAIASATGQAGPNFEKFSRSHRECVAAFATTHVQRSFGQNIDWERCVAHALRVARRRWRVQDFVCTLGVYRNERILVDGATCS